jgi:hypothetical protein
MQTITPELLHAARRRTSAKLAGRNEADAAHPAVLCCPRQTWLNTEHGGMKLKTPEKDKRQNRRMALEKKVGLAVSAGFSDFFHRKAQFEAKTRNASARGLELVSSQVFPSGTVIRLWVPVSGGEGPDLVLQMRGTIVGVHPDQQPNLNVLHVKLDDEPAKTMKLWEESIYSRIRLLQP